MADEDERLREMARERLRRYRKNKVQVSFSTTEEVRNALADLAVEHNYPSTKAFLEALAMGYLELKAR